MRTLGFILFAFISLGMSETSAQSNKIVFGPLEGDEAGILTVHNGEAIGVELWVRTDPDNPTGICGMAHGLSSDDLIIGSRNGIDIEPEYDMPNWEATWVDGPFTHNPDDPFPIPQGFTCEVQIGYSLWCSPFMDTNGEWDLYGTWLMVTNTGVPIEQLYYPFAMGWYPHSGQGTSWSFEAPPGGSVVPEQDYCGLYFETETRIDENKRLPQEFSLAQNYPNPFNAKTTIRYSLPEKSDVTIEIFDILGRKVETLVQERLAAGYHQVVWDAENQPSGNYMYWIKAGKYKESRSCLLLK